MRVSVSISDMTAALRCSYTARPSLTPVTSTEHCGRIQSTGT
jgi:hypothetical protein